VRCVRGLGQGSGVPSSRRCGEADKPIQFLAEQPEGEGKEEGLPEGKKTVALSRLSSGEGEDRWLRPVRGKEVLGAALL
jgi:hypothetical protein